MRRVLAQLKLIADFLLSSNPAHLAVTNYFREALRCGFWSKRTMLPSNSALFVTFRGEAWS